MKCVMHEKFCIVQSFEEFIVSAIPHFVQKGFSERSFYTNCNRKLHIQGVSKLFIERLWENKQNLKG